jgi:long-chain acyl-CoA synthetase
MARTIGEAWREAVAADRRHPPFLVQGPDGWREVGWEEAGARTDALAAGFVELGVGKGDSVAILSRTRLEWTLCDHALALIGAVTIPIYQTSSREECAHILSDADVRLLVCENDEQVDKTRGLDGDLPALERVVAVDEVPGVMALSEIEAAGRATLGRDGVFEPREAVDDSDVLTLIYTSGTTGPPKGCVITHRNFVAEVEAIGEVTGLFARGDVVLLFLPLAHNFARLVQYCAVRLGLTLAFCPEVRDLPRALEEVRPMTFPAVPRVFEKTQANVNATFAAARGPERRLIGWALGVGRRAAARREQGNELPRGLALQHRVADRLVFSKIRKRLGGRLRLAISGGAPLAREVIEFFAACNILILEGYGLSETTSGCTLNRPDRYRFGTVGLPLRGVELAVAPDGEIMIRGETVFQGYHRRPEDTAAVLTDDGWLLSGDIGSIDADGFLTITDRKKQIIVTAGGKKIPPQNLENALKTSPYVDEALVVGDRRPYLVALIATDEEEVAKLPQGADVHSVVAEAVANANRDLGRTEQIKRFAILPRSFSIEEGEVTPTLKLRRRVCEEHFRGEIEALYSAERE